MVTRATELKWFDMGRQRLAFEVHQLLLRFPDVDIELVDGELHVRGFIRCAPGGLEAEPLEFDLSCPQAFPAWAPKVKVVAPDLSQVAWGHKWHLLPEGRICFVRPSEWDIAFSLADVLDKVSDWYFNYLAVKHGLAAMMPDVGRVQL